MSAAAAELLADAAAECAGVRPEYRAEAFFLVAANELAQFLRHGKRDEEVLDGKELRGAPFAPRERLRGAAFRARAMTARNGRDGDFAARIAHTAHDPANRCATSKHGLRRLHMRTRNRRSMLAFISRPKAREDIREGDLFECWMRGRFAQTMSVAKAACVFSSEASVRCKYTIVVSRLVCPRYAPMLRKSTPASSKCVA